MEGVSCGETRGIRCAKVTITSDPRGQIYVCGNETFYPTWGVILFELITSLIRVTNADGNVIICGAWFIGLFFMGILLYMRGLVRGGVLREIYKRVFVGQSQIGQGLLT